MLFVFLSGEDGEDSREEPRSFGEPKCKRGKKEGKVGCGKEVVYDFLSSLNQCMLCVLIKQALNSCGSFLSRPGPR